MQLPLGIVNPAPGLSDTDRLWHARNRTYHAPATNSNESTEMLAVDSHHLGSKPTFPGHGIR
jgi:hypothetical protein